MLTGKVKLPEEPDESESNEVRQRINREIAKYKKLNGILYGRLPMAVNSVFSNCRLYL